MNRAALYQRANNVQRQDAKEILHEYSKVLQWRAGGGDRLLDVGCGSGDVLMDFVYPLMPKNFEVLLGTDVSVKMIDYARRSYAQYPHVNFRALDITNELPNELCEKFDRVTSFYCLHWIQNQKKALQNIYKLLRADCGDCLLVFLAKNPLFDVYKILYCMPKWHAYMKDVEQFIPPLFYSEDPSREYAKLLSEVGFVDYTVDIRDSNFIYEGVDNFKDNVAAVCPFLERMPKNWHDEYLNDFVNIVVSMNLRREDADSTTHQFVSSYKLVVVYGKKSDGFLNSVMHDDDRNIKGLN